MTESAESFAERDNTGVCVNQSLATKSGTRILTLLRGRSAVYAVLTDDRFIVVDTSTTPHRGQLFDQVDSLLQEGRKLKGLILTHTHFDHTENAAAFQERYQVPLFCNSEELDCLREGRSPVVSSTLAPIRFVTSTFSSFIKKRGRFEPVTEVTSFCETLDFSEWGMPVRLLHTPGHTPGSSSLIVDDEVVIAGDTLFGIVPHRVLPPFASDGAALYNSWLKLLATGGTIFLPSHGSARSIDDLRKGAVQLQKKNGVATLEKDTSNEDL